MRFPCVRAINFTWLAAKWGVGNVRPRLSCTIEQGGIVRRSIAFMFSALITLTLGVGCQEPFKVKQPDVVADLQTTPVAGPGPKAIELNEKKEGSVEAQPAVRAQVTMNKAAIMGRDFLYGADLQYSSISEEDYELILQSEAVGHFIVRYRILGGVLQMVADQTYMFESDVNHPERIVHEFRILSQNDESVTVAIDAASPVLSSLLNGKKAEGPRNSWLRSAEFVREGNYLLLETSIEQKDGSIAEFMETVFPRETVVPDKAPVIYNDSSIEKMAERFRFLDAGDIWTKVDGERVKTKVASRYNPLNTKPIEWWVTPNVPDAYLPMVRTGIEGWNRYSQAMWKRDMVVFKGKLPSGVKIGDPRYNVVNWDNIAEAGAAYESQATDPLTGIQSHSLIYLPLAWVNIGKTYWERGEPSESTKERLDRTRAFMENMRVMDRRVPLNCLRDAFAHIALEARYTPEEFAKELLKGVLFHEVGHALGLDHNFKGSLSFEPNDEKTMFTTSIMDYNQYQLERAAYDSLDAATGPLLEYDRQILSVLYNDGKDIKDSDPIVPACNDAETDSREGGADPLCIRYDAGHDPTLQLKLTMDMTHVESAHNRATLSLPLALRPLAEELLGDASTIDTAEKVTAKLKNLTRAIDGVVNFYFNSGAQSLNYMVRANIRSLYIFQKDKRPEYYKESEMRDRAIAGLHFVTNMETLDSAILSEIEKLQAAAQTWLQATPYFTNLSRGEQEKILVEALKAIKGEPEKLTSVMLPALRTRIIGELSHIETAPFFLAINGDQTSDFEAQVLEILKKMVTTKANGKNRGYAERAAAVKSLKSFADTSPGDAAIDTAKEALTAELATVKTAVEREDLRKLLKALN